jgi:DNA helicase-2/ATP-dependent DNA helicase PcrA
VQATLHALTEELDILRATALLPKLTKGLNPEQERALLADDGAVLVLAGAGSGKTTVLTRRVARLLSEGTPPERLFVATFTRKAADEMAARLKELLGDAGEALTEHLWIGTFHSHCLRILKQDQVAAGIQGFQIADEQWQLRAMRAILGDKDGRVKGLPSPPFGLNIAYDPKSALSAISAVKNRGHSVEFAERAFREHSPTMGDAPINTLCRIWRSYEMSKEARFDLLAKKHTRRLDFDDLLIECLRLLQEFPEVREKYQARFDEILIDETQDTSQIQWEIARLLAGRKGNVFIVGDIGQSIYAFRGADPRATIAQFTSTYPHGAIMRLSANYRSTGAIVRAANELIGQADIDKRFRLDMKPVRPEGLPPEWIEHVDAETEAEWVAQTLQDARTTGGLQLRNHAILFRTNAYSRCLEEALVTLGVPYRLEGALGFYGRSEVQDLVAFLQLSIERDSAEADRAVTRILNVPTNSFGKHTHFLGGGFLGLAIGQAISKRVSLYRMLLDGDWNTKQGLAVRDFRDFVKQVAQAGPSAEARLRKARDLGYDSYLVREQGTVEDEGNSRLDNLEELCVSAARFPTAAAFLEFVRAQQKSAQDEPAGDCVELMTVHRAKGLEWDTVIVCGFALGMIPHHRSVHWIDEEHTVYEPESVEEERRLAYVAITRARTRVVLSWPRSHQSRSLSRSPFLSEMPSIGATMPDPPIECDGNGDKPVKPAKKTRKKAASKKSIVGRNLQ